MDKGLEFVGPQILGSVNGIVVNFYKHVVNRKHHKRQEVIHHAQDNGRRSVDN